MSWNLIILFSCFKSESSNLTCCKVWWKNKNPEISDQKCLIWVFLGWNLKKTVVIFEILQKCLNLGPKMRDSGNFGLQFEKNYCQIWNQHPRICLIAKYHEIVRMPKFGIKSTKFGYFGARILKNDCHIWNQHLQIFLIP